MRERDLWPRRKIDGDPVSSANRVFPLVSWYNCHPRLWQILVFVILAAGYGVWHSNRDTASEYVRKMQSDNPLLQNAEVEEIIRVMRSRFGMPAMAQLVIAREYAQKGVTPNTNWADREVAVVYKWAAQAFYITLVSEHANSPEVATARDGVLQFMGRAS